MGKAPDASLNLNPRHSSPAIGDLAAENHLMGPTLCLWQPPPQNFVKINVDSSFLFKSKESCLAAVCRDPLGSWLGGIAMNTFCTDAHEAEVRAIHMCLQWAKQQRWDATIISSYCKKVVEEILKKRLISNTCNIAHDCRELLQGTAGFKLQHDGRESNRVADALAKYARGRATITNSL